MVSKFDKKMSIYLTDDLHRKLSRVADSRSIKVSAVIRQIIIEYFNNGGC